MEGPNTTFHPHKDDSTNEKVNTVEEDNDHGSSSGVIAGIAVGCTALVAVIVITTFLVSIGSNSCETYRTVIYNAIKCKIKLVMVLLVVYCSKQIMFS